MRCGIEGCAKPVHARGWCQMHYRRWRVSGDPLVLKKKRFPGTFWVKVVKTEGCWLWQGAIDPSGYGRTNSAPQISSMAHRVAYVLCVGSIPSSTPHLDHLCRNTACVRPDHLEPVTQGENNRRAGSARTHCGSGHLLTAANMYKRRSGTRECRTCVRERQAATRRSAKYHDIALKRMADAPLPLIDGEST